MAVKLEGARQGRWIVERRHNHMLTGIAWDPGRLRVWRRQISRPGCGQWRGPAVIEKVRIAVKVTFELDKLLAPGGGAGKAQRMHHGFAAASAKTRHFGAWHHGAQRLGQAHLMFGLGSRDRAQIQSARYRGPDRRVIVPQQRCPVREAHVDVRLAVQIKHGRAIAARDIERMAERGVAPRAGAHPARHDGAGALKQDSRR